LLAERRKDLVEEINRYSEGGEGPQPKKKTNPQKKKKKTTKPPSRGREIRKSFRKEQKKRAVREKSKQKNQKKRINGMERLCGREFRQNA